MFLTPPGGRTRRRLASGPIRVRLRQNSGQRESQHPQRHPPLRGQSSAGRRGRPWVWEQGFSDRLNGQGFATASFTFRRVGRAGGPAGLGDFLAETRAALATIEAEMGQPALLVAHSLGGLIAQRLLAEPSVRGAALLALMAQS